MLSLGAASVGSSNLFHVQSRSNTQQAQNWQGASIFCCSVSFMRALSRPPSPSLVMSTRSSESAQSGSASPLNIQFHRRSISGVFSLPTRQCDYFPASSTRRRKIGPGEVCPWCDEKWGGEHGTAVEQCRLRYCREKNTISSKINGHDYAQSDPLFSMREQTLLRCCCTNATLLAMLALEIGLRFSASMYCFVVGYLLSSVMILF